MGYYDDEYHDDEYHDDYEYTDLENQRSTAEESVWLLYEDFSKSSISEALESAGLIAESNPIFDGNMEKLIFSHGNDNEVYSPSEIRFTEQIAQVFMYSEFYKELFDKSMVCRVIAARIEETGNNALMPCIAFEKIANKAFDGFNIFMFVANDSVFFGCKLFDNDGLVDCALTNPIYTESQYEQTIDEFIYASGFDSFIDYYEQIWHTVSLLYYQGDNYYEDTLLKRRGIRYAYLDELDELGKFLGVDLSGERRRYYDSFYYEIKQSYLNVVEEVCKSLSFIQSNRVNTFELVADANEMLQQAEKNEERTENIKKTVDTSNDSGEDEVDKDLKGLLNNPEEVIKQLKKRRGL